MAYADEVLADSPVAYWRLGAGSTDVDDSSGNGHTLSKIGTPTEVDGLLIGDANKARDFPGNSSHYYQAADHADFDFLGTSNFSIEAWVNLDVADTTFRRIVGHEDASNGWALGVRSGTGFFFFRIAGGVGETLAFNPGAGLTGLTYHIVGTYDGTNLRIYINGVLQNTSGTVTTSMAATANTVRFGPFTGSSFADGRFDEIAVYSTALSGTRILAHYNAGLGAVVEADFILPWELIGASSANELGEVLSTMLVSRVWESGGAPTVTNDQSQGVAPGDIWIQSSNIVYICVSAAIGAAVWKKVSA